MADLTATQMLVLTSACARDDGIAIRPSTLNRSAAAKVAAKLLEQSLVQEQRAKPGWPVWRLDADSKAFSLKILKPGRAVVKAAAADQVDSAKLASSSTAGPAKANAVEGGAVSGQPITIDQPKTGSKRTLILALMQREGGASITELTDATGWLPHTTRAALTGLRKNGVVIVRSRDAETASSVYRIEQAAIAAAA